MQYVGLTCARCGDEFRATSSNTLIIQTRFTHIAYQCEGTCAPVIFFAIECNDEAMCILIRDCTLVSRMPAMLARTLVTTVRAPNDLSGSRSSYMTRLINAPV